MDNNINEICETIYSHLSSIKTELNEILLLLAKDEDLRQEYQSEFNVNENLFAKIKSEIMRSTKRCVVFGRISSGKSSLINAILQNKILKTSFGSTSNWFVEIRASCNKRNYVIINNEEMDITYLIHLNNENYPIRLTYGSHIDVFYNPERCPILQKGIVIIDTPGIDQDIIMNATIERYCSDADLTILVINVVTGLDNTIKEFFLRMKSKFSNLNLIIVFNACDLMDECEDREETKRKYIEDAKYILINQLQYSNFEAENRIFFLSSKERRKSFTSESNDSVNNSFATLDNELFNFLNSIETFLADHSSKSRIDLLESLHSFVSLKYRSLESEFMNNKCTLSDEILKQLTEWQDCGISDIKPIKELIKSNFSELSNDLIDKVIGEMEFLKTTKIKSVLSSPDKVENKENHVKEKEISKDTINNWLHKIIGNKLSLLKENIIAKMKLDKNVHCENIILTIYFPNYLDHITKIYSFDIEKIRKNVNEIKQIINIGKGISIGGAVLLAAIGGVAIGAACIFAAPLSGATAIRAVGAGAAGGGAVGGAVGGGIVIEGLENIKTPFHIFWAKYEVIIKECFDDFVSKLSESYDRFLEDLLLDFKLRKQLFRIQNELNNIKEEIQNFSQFSLAIIS